MHSLGSSKRALYLGWDDVCSGIPSEKHSLIRCNALRSLEDVEESYAENAYHTKALHHHFTTGLARPFTLRTGMEASNELLEPAMLKIGQ